MHSQTKIALAATVAWLAAHPAQAVQHVVTLSGIVEGQPADARYEFAGGFLQTQYGVPLVSGTALPPLERIVVESRTPSAGRTRGFHVPTAATGIPVVDGGTGVFSALTNVGSISRVAPAPAGDVNRAWIDDQSVAFTLARTGNTITYTLANGATPDIWSYTAASVADINALQFRMRSAGSNSVSLTNVQFLQGATTTNLGCNGTTCGTGLNGAFTATGGDVHISLFDQVDGDFALTGNWLFDLSPTRAGNNAQIKLLSLPGISVQAVPEPATWAMLIAGFGLVGAALRRRRAALA